MYQGRRKLSSMRKDILGETLVVGRGQRIKGSSISPHSRHSKAQQHVTAEQSMHGKLGAL